MTTEELYKSYRFRVETEGSIGSLGAFASFSGIRTQIQTIQVRSGSDRTGIFHNVPTVTSFEPVTLSKGVINENEFAEWLFSASGGFFEGIKKANLYRDLRIVTLDDKGAAGVVWTLKNALPVGYEVSPMESTKSEIIMESVVFAIEGVKRSVG